MKPNEYYIRPYFSIFAWLENWQLISAQEKALITSDDFYQFVCLLVAGVDRCEQIKGAAMVPKKRS